MTNLCSPQVLRLIPWIRKEPQMTTRPVPRLIEQPRWVRLFDWNWVRRKGNAEHPFPFPPGTEERVSPQIERTDLLFFPSTFFQWLFCLLRSFLFCSSWRRTRDFNAFVFLRTGHDPRCWQMKVCLFRRFYVGIFAMWNVNSWGCISGKKSTGAHCGTQSDSPNHLVRRVSRISCSTSKQRDPIQLQNFFVLRHFLFQKTSGCRAKTGRKNTLKERMQTDRPTSVVHHTRVRGQPKQLS